MEVLLKILGLCFLASLKECHEIVSLFWLLVRFLVYLTGTIL